MSGFADVYQRLSERLPDERARGRAFEPLVIQVLRSDPLYQAKFAKVWHWTEWSGWGLSPRGRGNRTRTAPRIGC